MIHYFWPTPIFENQLEANTSFKIQAELSEVILDKKSKDCFSDPWNNNRLEVSDNFKTNIFEEYELASFRQAIEFCVVNYLENLGEKLVSLTITDCWITKSTKHQYGHIHNHMPSDISGVYYFQTSQEDGSIFFENPLQIAYSSKLGNKNIFFPSYKIKPNVGKIILFPGWLSHGVDTNTTDSERISISFNIKL